MSIIQGNTKVSAGGDNIPQSIRFDKTTSSKLQQTQVTPDGDSWTISFWLKRGKIDASEMWFVNGGNGNPDYIRFETSEKIRFRIFSRGIDNTTTAVFRDPSAWYHFVANYNASTGAYNLWQNNVSLISGTGSAGSTDFNKASTLFTLMAAGNSVAFTDGYLAEVVKLDNIVSDPTAFGEYNDDGVWVPINVSGLTFGSNGFYITGADSADLGADYSGNGNDFTSSGLTSDDQVTDTPTENYATYTPLYGAVSYPATFSNGNLTAGGATSNGRAAIASIGTQTGKWYGEFTVDTVGTPILCRVGVVAVNNLYDPLMFSASEYAPQLNNVLYFANGTLRTYVPSYSDTPSWGDTFTNGDVIGVAYDADTGKVWFAKNNTWQSSGNPAAGTNPAVTLATGTPFYFQHQIFNNTWTGNFGQTGFTYTPPTGFKALSTANLPEPTIKDGSAHFQTSLWSGNSSTQEINQTGNSTFQPDLVWFKSRSTTYANQLQDAIRGVGNVLFSNYTNAESSYPSTITSLDADGFTLGSDAGANQSGQTYVGWQWLAGNGTASNTDGSITSTVSANTTAGFSIATFTAPPSGTFSVAHGLGVAPKFTTLKRRDSSTGGGWQTWHIGLGDNLTDYIFLNSSAAEASYSTMWGTDGRTSSVCGFTVGGSAIGSGDYVLYSFAEIEGFSKFGTYTGNGSTNGPFVWCNFRPSFLLIKSSSHATSWYLFDTERNPTNSAGKRLVADATVAEDAGTTEAFDFLSNGFKLRNTSTGTNGSGRTYIFMAFAEHPFGGSNVAPVPAR